MGLFDLFKRDLSNDPDLTRLRDLIIISASDSNYSMDENSIILDICREEGIDIDKLQKLFKMNPEKGILRRTNGRRNQRLLQGPWKERRRSVGLLRREQEQVISGGTVSRADYGSP